MVLLLTENDVRNLLTMPMALEAVEEAFRGLADGSAVNHSRRRLLMKGGLLHYMASAASARQVFGMKLYASFGGRVDFLVPLYSAEDGRLLALIEADWLGRLRTGAASGVATKYMARLESKTLGLFGTGGQARAQMLAVCTVRPIETVRVYSRNPQKRADFVEEMRPQVSAEVIGVEDPRDAVEGADIVTTMTTASQPVFEGAWLAPGTHVNAAGSNHSTRREIDGETVRRAARIAVDSVEQARLECGDLVAAVGEGITSWDNVIEFAEIVGEKVPGRGSPDEITLFESQGISIWDTVTAAYVYKLAQARGVGQFIPLFD
jgi:ornithine cyclodeaminase/alanine dehydrogenase-like protein (mu-crystallin family)